VEPQINLQLSHVGLFVRDLERMVAFYRDFMGFAVTDRGAVRNAELTFLSRDPKDHHQIVLATGRLEGLPDRILNQLSFLLGSLDELKAFHQRLKSAPASEIDPIHHGIAWSVYFRDPEGNRIEVFVDTPWYIPQPARQPIDLSRPAEEIYDDTRAFCEAQPGCRLFAGWRNDLGRRLSTEPDPAQV
jgi:catechol 2,3-dioxygenase